MAFDAFYGSLYGERWPALRAALGGQARPLGFMALESGGYELFDPETGAGAMDDSPQAYYLDAASVMAASALDLPEKGDVLDACAAPGGKSLVLAARLPAGARLLANELSADRRRRLRTVLDSCLPRHVRARVSILGADAASLCLRRPQAFAAILLDAPCSSERHVLADAAALSAWSPARPRSLARRQWALLSSAWHMLAPGGCLVYATCSLNPGENQEVALRLIERHGESLVVDPVALEGAEPAGAGFIILPDRSGGAGPMFVFKARKSASDAYAEPGP
jgi:16S rRNA (cytosine1407-C5)-methyltransferase